ncbi:hypothetical protein ACQP2F_18445 [Actinoplanes sp. CA-030573]|uniref:hypothetical protein n=1 Tax=Actinoplanes sp. CA-030573 TaxID=3239898 RepID=UPI003D8BE898
MPETSYGFLTLRRTAVELITFPDREPWVAPSIVASGQGERVATERLSEWLAQRFDDEIMPLLRDRELVTGKVADLSAEVARLEAAAAAWQEQTRVEELPGQFEVRISLPGEPPIRCRLGPAGPYEWTVISTREDQTVVRLPPELTTIRTTRALPPGVAALVERAHDIVHRLNPYRDRAERVRAELEFFRPWTDGRGTAANPEDDVFALLDAWAETQATMRPVVEPAEGWELRFSGAARANEANEANEADRADGRLFRAGPAGEWPGDQVLDELNQLARQGWRVVSVSEDKRVAGERNEPICTRYLLERAA